MTEGTFRFQSSGPRSQSGRETQSRRQFMERLGLSSALLLIPPAAARAAGVIQESSAACDPDAGVHVSPGLEKFLSQLQPGRDQFTSEKYAAEIEALLQEWTAAIRRSPFDETPIKSAIATDITFNPLNAFDSEALRSSEAIRVDLVQFKDRLASGREALLESFRSYLAAFTRIEIAEFQLNGLQINGNDPLLLRTSVRYDFVGLRSGDMREERVGAWSMEWQMDSSRRWRVYRWETLRETRASLKGPGFVDVSQECLRGVASYDRQLSRGVDYWRSTIDAAAGIDVYGNNGIAVGDFDGDGFDDFYVCQPSGLPNLLFRNRGDGTFEDVTHASGLGLLDGTASALFADFTNSGRQDLLVVRTSGPLLYLNRGGGKFDLVPDAFRFSKQPAGTFTGVAAADYNRDGLLDVYFCLYAYYQGLSQYTHPKPYYDAQNGPPNFLMRNRGNGVFEDVTASSGMDQNNNRFTFACGWCDYDNDGWSDLYVANDFGRKNFYRNNRDGTFTDIASEAGVEDYGAGMSVSWLDYDNDGKQDVYVTDMYSAAGTRITEQDSFLPGVDPAVRRAYAKHASGNSLFHNEGGGNALLDRSASAGVAMGRWSWAADAWDFDHDGYPDLYVTDGFISGPNRFDLSSFFWRQIVARSLDTGSGSTDYQLAWNAINELIRSDYSWNGYERNVFFLNNRNGTFSEIAGALGLDFEDDSRSFALADIDHDGRLEVLLKNRSGPQLRVLHNDLHSIGNSVCFRLQGRKSNRDAIGAVLEIETRLGKQTKCLQAGSGFLSQHTKELTFGVGDEAGPIRATIRWPAGGTQTFSDIPVQHRVLLVEGEPAFRAQAFAGALRGSQRKPASIAHPSLPARFDSWLIEPLPAPEFSLPELGGEVRTLRSFSGAPLALTMVRAGCPTSREQLLQSRTALDSFRQSRVQIAAMCLDSDSSAIRAFSNSSRLPFPVLLADKSTSGIYSILYRYLFDRRRELDVPVTFLVDDRQAIVKIYQGEANPQDILRDCHRRAAGTQASLLRALPFQGHFHGATPRRNFFTYGIAYIQNEYDDAALACFQTAIERNPNYAAAYYNLGTIYLNKQKLPEAKLNLERAVALDPHDADALTNLGAVAGQQKDYDTAYQYFEQAVQERPTHLVALQNLVMLDRWKGQLGHAEQVLQKAISSEPNDPEFHFALGMLLANQGKFGDARRELERSVQLRPGDPIALNNLGVVYLRLGNTSEAFNAFSHCVTMSPDYDRPYLNLASIYQQRGQVDKAKETLRSFLTRHPDNSELRQGLQSLGN